MKRAPDSDIGGSEPKLRRIVADEDALSLYDLPVDILQQMDSDFETLFMMMLTTNYLFGIAAPALQSLIGLNIGVFYDKLIALSRINRNAPLYRGLRQLFIKLFPTSTVHRLNHILLQQKNMLMEQLDSNMYDNESSFPARIFYDKLKHAKGFPQVTETCLRHNLPSFISCDLDMASEVDPLALNGFSDDLDLYGFSGSDRLSEKITQLILDGQFETVERWVASGLFHKIDMSIPLFFERIVQSKSIDISPTTDDNNYFGDGYVDEATTALIMHFTDGYNMDQAFELINEHMQKRTSEGCIKVLLDSAMPVNLFLIIWAKHSDDRCPYKIISRLAQTKRSFSLEWLEHPAIFGSTKLALCTSALALISKGEFDGLFIEFTITDFLYTAIIGEYSIELIDTITSFIEFRLSVPLAGLLVHAKLEKFIHRDESFSCALSDLENISLTFDLFQILRPHLSHIESASVRLQSIDEENCRQILSIPDVFKVPAICSLIKYELVNELSHSMLSFLIFDCLLSPSLDTATLTTRLTQLVLVNDEEKLALIYFFSNIQVEKLFPVIPCIQTMIPAITEDIHAFPKQLMSYIVMTILSMPFGFLYLCDRGFTDVIALITDFCIQHMSIGKVNLGFMNMPHKWALLLDIVKAIDSGYTHYRWVFHFVFLNLLESTHNSCSFPAIFTDLNKRQQILMTAMMQEVISRMASSTLIAMMCAPSMESMITGLVFRIIISRPNGFLDFAKSGRLSAQCLVDLLKAHAGDLGISGAFMAQLHNGTINPSLEPRVLTGFRAPEFILLNLNSIEF